MTAVLLVIVVFLGIAGWGVVGAAREGRRRVTVLGVALLVLLVEDGYLMLKAQRAASRAQFGPISLVVASVTLALCLAVWTVARLRDEGRSVRRLAVGVLVVSAFVLALTINSAATYRSYSKYREYDCFRNLGRTYEAVEAYRSRHGRYPVSLYGMDPNASEGKRSVPVDCCDGSEGSQLSVMGALTRHRVDGGRIPASLGELEALLRRLQVDSVPARIYVPSEVEPKAENVLVRDGPHTIFGYLRDTYVLNVLDGDGRCETVPFAVGTSLPRQTLELGGWLWVHTTAAFHDVAQLRTRGVPDVHAASDAGWQALHCAALTGNTDMIGPLVELGADVNAQDREGLTPLHVAAVWRQVGAVRALLSRGADASLRARNGETPLTLAERRGWEDITNLIEDEGGKE